MPRNLVKGSKEHAHAKFDTPVRSVGYFLGIKGKRTKHVVIAKEIIDNAKAFHYNVLPIGMIETVTVLAKDRLDPRDQAGFEKVRSLQHTETDRQGRVGLC